MHDVATQTTRGAFTWSSITATAVFCAVVFVSNVYVYETMHMARLASKTFLEMMLALPPFYERGVLMIALYALVIAVGATVGRSPVLVDAVRAIAAIFSALSGFLLFVDHAPPATHLGAIVTAELVLMSVVQLSSAASGLLPWYYVLVGPLGALALTDSGGGALAYRTPSHVALSILLYACMLPTLDAHSYRDVDAFAAHATAGEIYAFFQVMGSALVLSVRFMPRVRRDSLLLDLAWLGVFATSIFHNVGSAWLLVI
jgi:hypothetical protein